MAAIMDEMDRQAPMEPLLLAEQRRLAALRAGDEAAFAALVEQHQQPMLRLAQLYVGQRAVAEEVVQETWLALLQGLDRFEGRCSLKTWLFSILLNRARTRGRRERRCVTFTALTPDGDTSEPSVVDLACFHPISGGWLTPPAAWAALPEDCLLASETRACLEAAIAALPPAQRAVLTLRDIAGWSGDEICRLLNLTPANQRVLLHRARAHLRRTLAGRLDAAARTSTALVTSAPTPHTQ